jgi:hypothetical protein
MNALDIIPLNSVLRVSALLLAVGSLACPHLMSQAAASSHQAQQHAREISRLHAVCQAAGLTLPTDAAAGATVRKFFAAASVLKERGIELPVLTVDQVDAASEFLCVRGQNLQVSPLGVD